MIKKLSEEEYEKFWKEYSTNIKLGVIDDHANRTRLSKLLRFKSSNDDEKMTSLADYISRMKDNQEHIFFMAGTSLKEVTQSPFVERLLKKGYEVIYCVEPIDEYTVQALPEFDGKKFQNVAKEGLDIDGDSGKDKMEELNKDFGVLISWLKDSALKDLIEKATVSARLTTSPCALVASSYGWSGNMERIMKSQAYAKTGDPNNEFYASQKKILELNPRHPLIKELRSRVENDEKDDAATELAMVLFETATLRSGYGLRDTAAFSSRVEKMMRRSLGVSLDEQVEEEEEEALDEDEDAGDEGLVDDDISAPAADDDSSSTDTPVPIDDQESNTDNQNKEIHEEL